MVPPVRKMTVPVGTLSPFRKELTTSILLENPRSLFNVACDTASSALPRVKPSAANTKECSTYDLSGQYLRLACDLEANGYCEGYACHLFFHEFKSSYQENKNVSSRWGPEVSVLLTNRLMESIYQMLASDLEGWYAQQLNLSADAGPKMLIVIHHLTSDILIWHIDETRDRIVISEEWATTYNILINMIDVLEKEASDQKCNNLEDPLSYSPKDRRLACYEIKNMLTLLNILLPEFKRRKVERTSQCPRDMRKDAL
jgi:hypothetical protein